MKKIILLLLICTIVIAAGRIQNEDIKTEAELIAAGGVKAQLINDTKIYVTGNSINKTLDDAIIDGDIGGGGSGGINHIPIDGSNLEKNVDDWLCYDAGSACGFFILSQETTTPLRGTGSLKFEHVSTANVDGMKIPFTIDEADLATKQYFSFNYRMDDTDYSDGDFIVKIYDVTAAAFLETVFGGDIPAGEGNLIGYFQAHHTNTSYELVIVPKAVLGVNITGYIDNIIVGPRDIATGLVGHDFKPYTAVLNNFGNATQSLSYSRIGSKINIMGRITIGSTLPTGSLSIELPNGLVFDDSIVAANNPTGAALGALSSAEYIGLSATSGTNKIVFFEDAAAPTWNATIPATWALGNTLSVNITVPIKGWNSESNMSSEISNAEVSVEGSGSGGGSLIANVTDIDFTEVADDSNSWDGSKFTAPSTGTYIFMGIVQFTSNTTTVLSSYIDTIWKHRAGEQIVSESRGMFHDQVKLQKGEVWSLRSSTGSISLNTSVGQHWIYISKSNNPQSIFQNDPVQALYNSTSGASISSGSDVTVLFGDLVTDTHGSYNVSTGIFTVKVKGHYDIHTQTRLDNLTSSNNFFCGVKVNGNRIIQDFTRPFTTFAVCQASINKYLNIGDSVLYYVNHNDGTGANLAISSFHNIFSIIRSGD